MLGVDGWDYALRDRPQGLDKLRLTLSWGGACTWRNGRYDWAAD